MTIAEIDIKIKEYKKKLKSKRKVTVGNKTKNKKQPAHLRKYLNGEIRKLKKLKSTLENQKTKRIVVSWDNVIFDDFKIGVTDSNIFYGPIELKDSKKSFEYLKPFFQKLNLKKIVCIVKGRKIIEILNLNEIYNTIQIFNFKNLTLNYINYEPSDLLKSINKLNNKITISITKLDSKTDYLSHLINLNHIDYKIIPLLENGELNEDSFIFTLKTSNKIYLVWESCLDKKATYIFESTPEKYKETVVTIVKFILSEKTTRMDLRQNFMRENLNNIKCELIYHDSIKNWKQKLAKKTTS